MRIKKHLTFLVIPLLVFFLYQLYLYKHTFSLTIFYTNDIKGHLLPKTVDSFKKKKQIGGFSILTNFLSKQRKSEDVLIDVGNTLSGTFESDKDKGLSVIRLMNFLNYDAMCLGCYDLKWDKNNLNKLSEESEFPFVSTNYDIVDNIKPYTILNKKGIKIGIIGLLCEEVQIFCDKAKLRDNETFTKHIAFLKKEEKVDLIIALLSGSIQVPENLKGIDIILTTNKNLLNNSFLSEKTKTIVCSTKGQCKYIGRLDLVLREKRTKIINFKHTIIPLWLSNFGSNKQVDQKIAKIVNKLNYLDIGSVGLPLLRKKSGESNLGNLITDLMRRETNTDVAIFYDINFKSRLNVGHVTNSMIYELFPFNYQIVKSSFTGKQLKKIIQDICFNNNHILDISGLKIVFSKEFNKKKKEIFITEYNSKQLVDSKIYSVSANKQLFNSNIYINYGIIYKSTDFTVKGLLTDYFRIRSPVVVHFEGRIKTKIK